MGKQSILLNKSTSEKHRILEQEWTLFIAYQVQLLHTADEKKWGPNRLSNLQQTHQEFLLVYNDLVTKALIYFVIIYINWKT